MQAAALEVLQNHLSSQRVTVSANNLAETRILLRRAFYSSLHRKTPRSLIFLPSYVRAVQRQFGLSSRNQARAMLAEVEGFDSWRALMNAALLQQTERALNEGFASEGAPTCSPGESM